METNSQSAIPGERMLSDLRNPQAYPHSVAGAVVVCETHISWVFLAGDFAYKIKKPIKSPFLDYSTLKRRQHFCHEELRLDRRYAPDLYLAVVPITCSDQQLRIEGSGQPVEYAVKMHRFPDGALLSRRLAVGAFTAAELQRLVRSVAEFHLCAATAPHDSRWGAPAAVRQDALDNLDALENADLGKLMGTVHVLRSWTNEFFSEHECLLAQRVANGFIRECHGDLHLANVIDWRGKIMPFDGIEFNDRFRWIDVLSDAAFLAMDFAARDHLELCRSFINAYLERTGDHASLPLLRWYLVYRSLVRAKVDAMKMGQQRLDHWAAFSECQRHIELAYRFSLPVQPTLWITHGVSGSGKTTGSERVVQKHGAIRLRSDLERKRHFGLDPWGDSPSQPLAKLYSEEATAATYGRLRQLAHSILQGGDSVVVDATFLRRQQRESFCQLADCLGVSFGILHFDADVATLRQRITDRISRADDVSDADLSVLESQLASQEPLSAEERQLVTPLPGLEAKSGQVHLPSRI